jgi:hypothetical protein
MTHPEVIQEIRKYKDLPVGWDSYHAQPMNETSITNALKFVDILRLKGVEVEYISATSDESIFLRYLWEGTTVEWEFYNDGDNVKVVCNPKGKDFEYYAVGSEEFPTFAFTLKDPKNDS